MAFIDEAVINVISGAGGNGCVSFRREKFIPFGGPNGGNGGRGGSVLFRATRDKGSLLDFKFQPKYEAKRGQHGMGSDMDGRGGDDLTLQVPVGTLIFDETSRELIADLDQDGMELQIAKGGRGGRGNKTFTTSTNRAPRTATPGEPGELKQLRLELRLLADFGLIGLPNAGKSSFLRRVSRATPKVADYPFTTLEPHLGVVDQKGRGFVIADLPGLIAGAAEGVGLGHKFLRHVARTRLLLHLVDIHEDTEQILANARIIEEELSAYDPELATRERWLVFTKADVFSQEVLTEKLKDLAAAGLTGYCVSSQSGFGIDTLLDRLAERVAQDAKADPITASAPLPTTENEVAS